MTQMQLRRHPGRAAFWGLLLGLGIAVYLTFVWPVIGLDGVAAVAVKWGLIVGGVMLLAILWGSFGPARRPHATAPVPVLAPAPWGAPPAPPADQPPPLPDLPPPAPEV